MRKKIVKELANSSQSEEIFFNEILILYHYYFIRLYFLFNILFNIFQITISRN